MTPDAGQEHGLNLQQSSAFTLCEVYTNFGTRTYHARHVVCIALCG